MAGEIGTAYVGVELDTKGVGSQLGGLGGQMQSQLGPLGNIMGASMKAGLVGAAAGAAIAVGKYLYDIGEQFDAMADTIAVATGATGDDLEGLVDVAKEVGTEVPVSFEDAGTAVAQLASKTGLAGKPLKDLTTQVVSLAKITEQDLGTTIESSTRLLGDWGLAGADASEGLDTLFKASQATGVETGRLAELMTKFGGPFRTLGFSFEESAAMLGKWQKEGVNTELVAGSMRIALGKFAKAGRDPAVALQETIKEIQRLGPGAEATALAMETFGAKAGTDMAAAVLEGRFAIGDLVDKIDKSKSTIKGAEEGTRDFAEQWLMFKNQVAVALAPVAERLFSAIGDGMAMLNKELPPLIDSLEKDFGPAVASIGEAIEGLRPVFDTVFPVLVAYVKIQIAAFRLIAEVVAGVVQLVSALLRGDWSAAWDAAQKIVGAFATYFKTLFDGLKVYLTAVLTIFKAIAVGIGNAVKDGIMAGVNLIKGLVTSAFTAVVQAVRDKIDGAKSAGEAVANGIKNGLMAVVNTIDNLVKGAISAMVTAVREKIDNAKSAGEALGTALWNGIKAGVKAVAGLGGEVAGHVRDAAQAALNAATTFGSSVGKAIYQAILDGLSGIGQAIRDLIPSPGDLFGGITGALGKLDPRRMAPAPPAEPGVAAAAMGPTALAGGAAGGLAGPVPLAQRARRAVAGIAPAAVAGAPALEGLELRVYIGDTELRGLVRSEVVSIDTGIARTLLAGGRTR